MVSGPAVSKDAPYRFGDYARPSLDARLALGESFELAGGVLLPPKRSEVTDVPTIMGGFLLLRQALGPRSSLYLQGFTERLLPLLRPRDDGAWASASFGYDAREFVDRRRRWLAFAGNLGANGGRAVAAGGSAVPWLIELQTGGAVHLMAMDPSDGDGVGLSAGVDFAFPVRHGGRAFWAPGAPALRPQNRADVHLAAYATLATGWDVSFKNRVARARGRGGAGDGAAGADGGLRSAAAGVRGDVPGTAGAVAGDRAVRGLAGGESVGASPLPPPAGGDLSTARSERLSPAAEDSTQQCPQSQQSPNLSPWGEVAESSRRVRGRRSSSI